MPLICRFGHSICFFVFNPFFVLFQTIEHSLNSVDVWYLETREQTEISVLSHWNLIIFSTCMITLIKHLTYINPPSVENWIFVLVHWTWPLGVGRKGGMGGECLSLLQSSTNKQKSALTGLLIIRSEFSRMSLLYRFVLLWVSQSRQRERLKNAMF